jgi:heme-degrading monooxygenase HmoA
MLMETVTFRLAADTDESAFLEADKRVQTEFIPNQPGFLRRTTARGHDGEWLVVVLWNSENDADTCTSQSDGHPATMAFTALLDSSTLRTKRYETLD